MAPKRELFVATGGATPPEKRPRAAEAAPGGGGGTSPEPPPSPKHFLAIVLVVLFLKRPKGRNTDPITTVSVSQFGRLMRDQICRFMNPLFCKLETMDSKLETMGSKLEKIEEHVHDLTVKVDNIIQTSPNHHNHEKFTQEANHEGTTAEAEGLVTTEGKGENARIQLRFLNGMKTQVYHDDEIKSNSNTAIKIGIFDGEKMIESGVLSDLQIEIFALEGDFPHASPKSWNAKKFNKHRANGRDGKGNVLAGEGTKAQLKNGQCDLGSIKFTEGSCKARKGKFIIGARVCEGEVSGVKIQEAIMNPVVVQDRRNKANEKSHPPKLNDSVHRLEEIAKDGRYYKRLAEKKIFTVEDFLKALNKNPDNLAKILNISKEHKAWEKMTKHARECSLEGRDKLKLFIYEEKKVNLYFNCVHCLVGAEFMDGHYTLFDMFSPAQVALVDGLKEDVYAILDVLPEDYVMTDNSSNPIHIDTYTGVGAGPFYMPSEQPTCSVHLAAVQVGAMAVAGGSSYARIEPSCPNANNDPVTSSSVPDNHNIHNYQGGGLPVPPLEGLSGAQIELSRSNANDSDPVPSSSINYQDQWTHLASQVQFSAFLDALRQDTHGNMGNMYGQIVSNKDVVLPFLQHQAGIHTCVEPGLDDVAIQSQPFQPGSGTLGASTSSHINMTITSQQLIVDGNPWFDGGTPRSAEGSMQSQMQAPLTPGNGVPEATGSAQQALPPQQWPPCNESF